MAPKVNVVKKCRAAARLRTAAAVRQSARKAQRHSVAQHAAIWGGTAARFTGFDTKAGK